MATYYVSSAGSDANDGLSEGAPKLTIAAAATASASGDTIRLRGGDTFADSVSFTSGRTLNSYGTGRATLAPSSSTAHALKFTDCGGITVADLILDGANTGTPNGGSDPDSFRPAGIEVLNTSAGTTKYTGVSVTGCEVSGFISGVFIYNAGASTAGYDQITVDDNHVHDCTAFGILMWATNATNTRTIHYTNLSMDRNEVHDIPGYATRIAGIPLVPAFTSGGSCSYNLVYHSGHGATNAGSGGPGGIVAVACDGTLFEWNEIYDISETAGGADGIGMDLDWACINCIAQYNYCHGNDGAGFYLFDDDGGNHVRFNLSVDNCRGGAWGEIDSRGSGDTNYVYNNTVVATAQNATNNALGLFADTSSASVKFYNNVVSVPNSMIALAARTSPASDAEGNVYHQRTGTPYSLFFYWNNVGYSTLAAFRTATGKENHGGVARGYHGDPSLFGPITPVPTVDDVDALDGIEQYRLTDSSAVLGDGLDLATLFGLTMPATDMAGYELPASGYSPGAFNHEAGYAPASPASAADRKVVARSQLRQLATALKALDHRRPDAARKALAPKRLKVRRVRRKFKPGF